MTRAKTAIWGNTVIYYKVRNIIIFIYVGLFTFIYLQMFMFIYNLYKYIYILIIHNMYIYTC